LRLNHSSDFLVLKMLPLAENIDQPLHYSSGDYILNSIDIV
jgi:hypothetical protein